MDWRSLDIYIINSNSAHLVWCDKSIDGVLTFTPSQQRNIYPGRNMSSDLTTGIRLKKKKSFAHTHTRKKHAKSNKREANWKNTCQYISCQFKDDQYRKRYESESWKRKKKEHIQRVTRETTYSWRTYIHVRCHCASHKIIGCHAVHIQTCTVANSWEQYKSFICRPGTQ